MTLIINSKPTNNQSRESGGLTSRVIFAVKIDTLPSILIFSPKSPERQDGAKCPVLLVFLSTLTSTTFETEATC